MGLDLVVEACAKPGHENEWRGILRRSFDEEPGPGDEAQFPEISIPPYERIGAPRVGFDPAADAWIIEQRKARTADEVAAALKDFHGHYVLPLVECDGVPQYSNGGLYEGLDETSFRGAFLIDCTDVLSRGLIDAAWNHKFPDEAIRYGHALLAAGVAVTAARAAPRAEEKRGILSRLMGATKSINSIPLEEQLKIVDAAGKWFIFWGERGHAIRAWF